VDSGNQPAQQRNLGSMPVESDYSDSLIPLIMLQKNVDAPLREFESISPFNHSHMVGMYGNGQIGKELHRKITKFRKHYVLK
jgi:hypothetical protein